MPSQMDKHVIPMITQNVRRSLGDNRKSRQKASENEKSRCRLELHSSLGIALLGNFSDMVKFEENSVGQSLGKLPDLRVLYKCGLA